MAKPESTSCWADRPEMALIARRVDAFLADLQDARAEMKIEDKGRYVKIKVICSIRLPRDDRSR